jgi:cobalt-zinc-cadmium efflux system protein
MLMDAAGSVAAVVAGLAVVLWDAPRADPIASMAIAVLVLWSGWSLLGMTVHVLLEGTPRGMDPGEVEAAIAREGAVESVHHLHTWNIASDVPALSAHVVLEGEVTLHEAQEHGDRIKAMLASRFGIEHATLELECHSCEPD